MTTTPQGLRYTRKATYYRQPTHEFNLPAGWSCPHADACLTKADRDTGRLVRVGPGFRCYAASAERFPSARDSRWANYDAVRRVLQGPDVFDVPARATHVRIHGSGDFFSPAYFARWCQTAAAHPGVRFWAFTKSVRYWLEQAELVPDNLVLQASIGGKQDALALHAGVKTATVYRRLEDVPADVVVDVDDGEAQVPGPGFALLENVANRGAATSAAVAEHNERARRLRAD